MTFEEMNRAFEFMIRHGADLDVRLAKLEKLHENHHDVIAELVLARERMDKRIEIDSRRFEQEHRDLKALIEIDSKRLARLEEEDREIKARLDKSMQELRESLNRLFEKLS
jgi:hypothetical protein